MVTDMEIRQHGVSDVRRLRDAAPKAVIVVVTVLLDPAGPVRATQAGASPLVSRNGVLGVRM
jgi:DNA-binding NarL/FixJ family response regulator